MLKHEAIKRIHCIGVGGIGVSALAEWLLLRGYEVTGSDAKGSMATSRLEQMGLTFFEGHSGHHVHGADLVVFSSAIRDDNPEVVAAKKNNLPMMKRGALLADIAKSYHSIAVSGTHGKTTTTSLLAYCLRRSGLKPSSMIGGVINGDAGPVSMGEGRHLVMEADESDASFLYMQPQVAVVTNIEHDHVETYSDNFDHIRSSFLQFLSQLPDDGVALLCVDDVHVQSLVPLVKARVVTYGTTSEADIRGIDFVQQGLTSLFTVDIAGESYPVELNLPGQHNMLNALAVLSLFYALGLPVDKAVGAMREFPGVARRFEYKENVGMGHRRFHVVEDYGHHPTEVRVTLDAVRAAWPGRRVLMVFQPHRVSRTAYFMKEFAEVLSCVDQLLLLGIYSVGFEEGVVVQSECLKKQIGYCNQALPVDVVSDAALFDVLDQQIRHDDVLLFQGAGSVGHMVQQFLSSQEIHHGRE